MKQGFFMANGQLTLGTQEDFDNEFSPVWVHENTAKSLTLWGDHCGAWDLRIGKYVDRAQVPSWALLANTRRELREKIAQLGKPLAIRNADERGLDLHGKRIIGALPAQFKPCTSAWLNCTAR